MSFLDRVVITNAKTVSRTSTTLRLGAGETWPGELALSIRPKIASYFANQLTKGVILVAGTNGKTTTTLMIKKILESKGDRVVTNASGANLLNGIVSSFIKSADWKGDLHADVGLFEVDENSLPVVLQYITPKHIVILNLFRDQLDRYGEVDIIIEKWQKVLRNLLSGTEVILNSDDPSVAYLGKLVSGKVTYFGLNDAKKYIKEKEHATDSTFCPNCGERLNYSGVYYSHIGIWECKKCGTKRQTPDVHIFPQVLSGLYNQYNTLAAVACAKTMGISEDTAASALQNFEPAFGRQELLSYRGKKVKLFLSKNPTGFNASLRTVQGLGAKHLFLVLNDRIPDGRDVSWIWDVDFEMLKKTSTYVAGDRVYDLALRLAYSDVTPIVARDLQVGLHEAVSGMPKGEVLYVLATYSAMLDVRKILTGKKIL